MEFGAVEAKPPQSSVGSGWIEGQVALKTPSKITLQGCSKRLLPLRLGAWGFCGFIFRENPSEELSKSSRG